jgi:uncharacterized damage-inducible protein DinB
LIISSVVLSFCQNESTKAKSLAKSSSACRSPVAKRPADTYDYAKTSMNAEQLLETWEINDRINLYLLDGIDDEHLGAVMTSKGRSAGELFAHIHNVGLMWLKAAMPVELDGLTKFEKGDPLTKQGLKESLAASAAAISRLIANAAASGGRVKGFKPHVTAFVGYLIAHDSHHRSQAIIALKQAGHLPDKKVLYGIWEWGSR